MYFLSIDNATITSDESKYETQIFTVSIRIESLWLCKNECLKENFVRNLNTNFSPATWLQNTGELQLFLITWIKCNLNEAAISTVGVVVLPETVRVIIEGNRRIF